MQQHEPKVVEAIVPERHPNHWSSAFDHEAGATIEVRSPEVLFDDEMDPVILEVFLR